MAFSDPAAQMRIVEAQATRRRSVLPRGLDAFLRRLRPPQRTTKKDRPSAATLRILESQVVQPDAHADDADGGD
jgi:hypothetical protein